MPKQIRSSRLPYLRCQNCNCRLVYPGLDRHWLMRGSQNPNYAILTRVLFPGTLLQIAILKGSIRGVPLASKVVNVFWQEIKCVLMGALAVQPVDREAVPGAWAAEEG